MRLKTWRDCELCPVMWNTFVRLILKIGCNWRTFCFVKCLWIVNKVVKKSLPKKKKITQLVINKHHWQKFVSWHTLTNVKIYQAKHWENNSLSTWIYSSWNLACILLNFILTFLVLFFEVSLAFFSFSSQGPEFFICKHSISLQATLKSLEFVCEHRTSEIIPKSLLSVFKMLSSINYFSFVFL